MPQRFQLFKLTITSLLCHSHFSYPNRLDYFTTLPKLFKLLKQTRSLPYYATAILATKIDYNFTIMSQPFQLFKQTRTSLSCHSLFCYSNRLDYSTFMPKLFQLLKQTRLLPYYATAILATQIDQNLTIMLWRRNFEFLKKKILSCVPKFPDLSCAD